MQTQWAPGEQVRTVDSGSSGGTSAPRRPPGAADPEGPTFPPPVYPRRPLDRPPMTRSEYTSFNRRRAVRCWLGPYVRSQMHRHALRPLLAYLFTEWKCNLDCHYCWARDNRVKGMSEAVARRSVDWLHDTGCRALAIMGGEPLLRPAFMHRLVDYAVQRGFFVYLPTNGRLMKPEVTDRLGDAGMSTVNLAVDVVDERPGLPKALTPIRRNFEHLLKRQCDFGYTVFLNINITRLNMDDALALTEIARDHGIATDYHLNEEPMLEQPHFGHADDNATYLRPEDFPKVDALLDRLIEKNRAGYKMVNSVQHFNDMKAFMRGHVDHWACRAGQNALIIRTDGTLAPCFTMYSASTDWGAVGDPRFDEGQLDEMKRECHAHCLSTCQHTLGYAFSAWNTLRWLGRQARNGFRGVTGSY
jgi:MoaA/NifB/PqqE/SkfB family radical SAM enzyme